jgi:hypothetical protein
MSGSKPVQPPWWLKPANKVFIRMSRLGRPEEFEALAGRCAVFRLDGIQ